MASQSDSPRTPRPTDPQALWQEAVGAFQRGDLAASERALAPLLEHLSPTGEMDILAGLIALQRNDPKTAERYLRRGTKQAPERLEGWIALGNARLLRDKAGEAVEAFAEAVRRAPDNAGAHNNLGIAFETMGRYDRALTEFERAYALQPDPGVDLSRARCLVQLGRAEEARARYAELVAAHPREAGLAIEFAELLERNNELAEAERKLPGEAEVTAAPLLARRNALLARLQARAGEHEAALHTVTTARQRTRDDTLGYQQGQYLDRLGRYEEAVEAFTAANKARAAQPAFQRLQRQRFGEFVAAKAERGLDLPATDPAEGGEGRGGSADADAQPIFLIGLPRSGTTLVDRMLGAHPGAQVLEEFEGLRLAEDALAAGESVATARAAWREHIEGRTQLTPGARIIDKNPLHAAHLDTLARVFPDAPVVFVLRHPFDAALSCWMQDFQPNPATVHFLERASTARLCAGLLELMRQFEAGRPGQVTRLRYEDLVGDFRGEVGRVLDAVGLGWDDAVSDYAARAADSGMITTPSYDQVTRGLYTSAVERWRHYRPWLDDFAEPLGLLTAAYGYSAD